MYDLEACKDEVRLVPDSEFEFVHLGYNPARSVKIGFELPVEVRSTLTKFLQDTTYIFAISPHEMLDIDPDTVCHSLNMDSSACFVS